jgi:hypothetical protein
MKISIVVPAFNEEKFLDETLAQIKSAAGAFAKTGWETELIVCDNNSTDHTAGSPAIARCAGNSRAHASAKVSCCVSRKKVCVRTTRR